MVNPGSVTSGMTTSDAATSRPRWDALIAGARVIDPRNGFDARSDVAISGDKIAAIADGLPQDQADNIVHAEGMLVVPGLIDLHTHIYHRATAYGVEPEPIAKRSGTVTMVDAGSAGAGNFAGLRDFVFAGSPLRLLAFVNISYPGIFVFDRDYVVGEAAVRELLSVDHCVETINANRHVVVGVKVRLGARTSGDIGLLALDRAIEAAERTGLPVMAHIGKPPPTYSEILARLRPGDILTHCFRPAPNAPVDGVGNVLPALVKARDRGVLFDIGHGMGAFGFDSAEAAIAQGFLPDIISSDVHSLCVDGPAFDLLHTMSKLMHCGIALADVVAMATDHPAQAMKRADLGELTVGGRADLTLLEQRDAPIRFADVQGIERIGSSRLVSCGTFVAGTFRDNAPGECDQYQVSYNET